MVGLSSQIEGALDILSCATLMQLAVLQLPPDVNGAVILFCLLEVANSLQSFSLLVILSGEKDSPLELVRWKATLRASRGVVDFGCFFLRLILWVEYDAVSSVFLIKNLYNLMHASAQVERYFGARLYRNKEELFLEFLEYRDWYGMSKAEWKKAIGGTIVQQAQAGRPV